MQQLDIMDDLATSTHDAHSHEARAELTGWKRWDGEALLTFAQEELWRADKDAPATPQVTTVHLHGALERDVLRSALNRAVSRHEILRAAFPTVQGEPAVIIADGEEGFAITEQDMSVGCTLERAREQELQDRLDLSSGPLIRGRLLRLSDQEHFLLITYHPIIADDQSIGLLVEEVARLYDAFAHGQVDPLPPVKVPFTAYATWQRRSMSAIPHDRLQFWSTVLAAACEPVPFPTDRQCGTAPARANGEMAVQLPTRLAERVRAMARCANVLCFDILLASWAALIARCSGAQRLVMLAALPGRPHVNFERSIGPFESTVGLVVDMRHDLTTQQLFEQIAASRMETMARAVVSFAAAQRTWQSPVGDVPQLRFAFAMRTAPGALSDVRAASSVRFTRALEPSSSGVELSLTLMDDGHNVAATLQYASDLFAPATVERLAARWQTLLQGMTEGIHERVMALAMMPASEFRQVVHEFNDTRAECPTDRLIHEIFEEHARRTPEVAAVAFEDQSLSYGEINDRANQLARYLISRGVRPDHRVGICVERGVELAIALIGIFKAGGAYVPLDPTYPVEMLGYMLQDASPTVVLIQERLRGLLPDLREAIALDAQWGVISGLDCSDIDPASIGLAPNHLAYVIYTSGSTGRPKGVMVEHRSVVNLWAALETCIYRSCTDCRRVAVNASFAFDSSVKQLIQLLSGRTLIIVPHAVRLDAAELLKFIERFRVESFDCTPTQLGALVAAGMLRQASGLPRVVLVGGEDIDRALWSQLAACTQTLFYNVYGPTECTVDAAIAPMSESPHEPTIGRPIDNVQIYLLDDQRQPVPIGVEGEIYIGGKGVARGYLGRPELTAERFLNDPLASVVGARFYKTGDLGRWRADGSIHYLGRNDRQVKVRGFRIELGEIEARLRTDPRVQDAVVVAREDIPGDLRLVGYVIPRLQQRSSDSMDGSDALTALGGALRDTLKQILPTHMIPTAIMTVDSFPLTANGKLDQSRLPVPAERATARQVCAAALTPIEQRLTAIWQEAFNLEQVGVEDNFFDLGGHSVLAMRLMTMLSDGFAVQLPFLAIFEYPTIRMMASHIDQLKSAASPSAHWPAGEVEEGTL
jgi:amino acid adenylation domain-containing protein